MGQCARQQRDQETQNFVFGELSETAPSQCVEQAGSRDDEHQRHHKGRGKLDPYLHRGIPDVILHVPTFHVVEPRGVKGKHEQYA